MALGQIRFTWARRGLEGNNKFRSLPAPRPESDGTAAFVEQARRLCRYPVPAHGVAPAEAPISFGWKDVGKTRYVFHRVYIGQDALGRDGNFAAHVLFGRMAELGLPSVLQSYGSPTWWTGDPLGDGDRRLERTSLAAFAPAPPDPPTAVTHADELYRVLSACYRGGTVPIGSTALVRALRSISEIVPDLVDVGAFSSYEDRTVAYPVDDYFMFGVGDAENSGNRTGRAVLPAAARRPLRSAAELILADRDRRRVLSDAWADSAGGQIDEWLRVVDAATVPMDGADVDWPRFAPLFFATSTLNLVLSCDQVRQRVAEKLAVGEEEFAQMFLSGVHRLRAPIAADLIRRTTAIAMGLPQTAAPAWHLTYGLSPAIRSEMVHEATTLLRDRPDLVRTWPEALVIQVARESSTTAFSAAGYDALVAALSDASAPVLVDPEVPTTVRADVYLGRRAAGRHTPSLAELARDTDLLVDVLNRASDDGIVDDFQHVPTTRVAASLFRGLPSLDDARACALLRYWVRRAPAAEVLLHLLELAQHRRGSAWLRTSGVCSQVCADFAAAYLADSRITIDFANLAEFCRMVGDDPWGAVFSSARDAAVRGTVHLDGAAPGRSTVEAALQLDACLGTSRTLEGTRAAVASFRAHSRGTSGAHIMRLALRAAARRANAALEPMPVLMVLLYVAVDHVQPAGKNRACMAGQADPEIRALASRSWTYCRYNFDQRQLGAYATAMTKGRRRARAWLESLDAIPS